MSLISLHAPLPITFRENAKAWSARVPRRFKLLAAALLMLLAADQIWVALESPAERIRDGLSGAGYETAALSWKTPPEAVQRAVADYFPGRAVSVDPTRFPAEVSVALRGIDRATCVEALGLARRMEGSVVIALDGYASPADCAAENVMIWRIMP